MATKRRSSGRKPRLGSGRRFSNLKRSLKRKGARNPAALAAYIGAKKHGRPKMQSMAAKGRRRAARRSR